MTDPCFSAQELLFFFNVSLSGRESYYSEKLGLPLF